MRRTLASVAGVAAVWATVVSGTGARATDGVMARPMVRTAVCTPGKWVQTPATVSPAMGQGVLFADTIVSSKDAWAVGYYFTSSGVSGRLWEQWNGSKWKVATDGGTADQLNDVANFGASDVWAVGQDKTNALMEQWNGHTLVPTIVHGSGINTLTAISGSSASDIWAQGNSRNTSTNKTRLLLYRYNGTAWIASPIPKGTTQGYGILDLSPTDVLMLAGNTANGDLGLYRYNGTAWSLSQASVPLSRGLETNPDALTGSSDTDLFGVGESTGGDSVQHWNGTTWAAVGPLAKSDFDADVAEGPIGTVWSAGLGSSAHGGAVYVTRNGVHQTSPPSIMTQPGHLYGIATGSGLVIAVGHQFASPGELIVLMSCD